MYRKTPCNHTVAMVTGGHVTLNKKFKALHFQTGHAMQHGNHGNS